MRETLAQIAAARWTDGSDGSDGSEGAMSERVMQASDLVWTCAECGHPGSGCSHCAWRERDRLRAELDERHEKDAEVRLECERLRRMFSETEQKLVLCQIDLDIVNAECDRLREENTELRAAAIEFLEAYEALENQHIHENDRLAGTWKLLYHKLLTGEAEEPT